RAERTRRAAKRRTRARRPFSWPLRRKGGAPAPAFLEFLGSQHSFQPSRVIGGRFIAARGRERVPLIRLDEIAGRAGPAFENLSQFVLGESAALFRGVAIPVERFRGILRRSAARFVKDR